MCFRARAKREHTAGGTPAATPAAGATPAATPGADAAEGVSPPGYVPAPGNEGWLRLCSVCGEESYWREHCCLNPECRATSLTCRCCRSISLKRLRSSQKRSCSDELPRIRSTILICPRYHTSHDHLLVENEARSLRGFWVHICHSVEGWSADGYSCRCWWEDRSIWRALASRGMTRYDGYTTADSITVGLISDNRIQPQPTLNWWSFN